MGEHLSHYFIEDHSLAPHIESFAYYFGSEKFLFMSNSGMFSPGHVDDASDLLLHTMPALSGSFLDLGCGYGVIGIVMGKMYHLDVTMADINGRALDCAKINCENNGLKADIIESNCFEQINRSFDAIALNPPIHAGKEVVHSMYEGAFEHLHPSGTLYVVIQKKHGGESAVKKLTELFHSCETLYKKKGYFVLACTK